MADTRTSVTALAVSNDNTARARVRNLPPSEFTTNGIYNHVERARAEHDVRALLNSQLGHGISVNVDRLGPD